MTEMEKMVAGENYDALDAHIMAERLKAHDLCHSLSACRPSSLSEINAILRQLLPNAAADIVVTPPFFCDYGWNISIGAHFFCNAGCIILDAAPVSIGKHVLLGPNVQIYTATHAIDPDDRAALVQSAIPVSIDDKVWLGGGATICPGVHIGEGSVIGAGSVVTHDIPPFSVAAGNPCSVIKQIKKEKKSLS